MGKRGREGKRERKEEREREGRGKRAYTLSRLGAGVLRNDKAVYGGERAPVTREMRIA